MAVPTPPAVNVRSTLPFRFSAHAIARGDHVAAGAREPDRPSLETAKLLSVVSPGSWYMATS